jgi:hypothetical protein
MRTIGLTPQAAIAGTASCIAASGRKEVRNDAQISYFANTLGPGSSLLWKANGLTIQMRDFPEKLLHYQMVHLNSS